MSLSDENINPAECDADSAASPLPLAGLLVERRERRRMDLFSYDGILREHARIYRSFKDGKVGFKKFDAASRALRRQGELLRDKDTKAVQDRELIDATRVIEGDEAAKPTLGDFYRAFQVAHENQTNGESQPSTVDVPPQ